MVAQFSFSEIITMRPGRVIIIPFPMSASVCFCYVDVVTLGLSPSVLSFGRVLH